MYNFILGIGLLKAIFGDAVNTLTFQRRLGSICFILISLFMIGAGYYRSQQIAADLAALATDGVAGQGVVVDKTQQFRNNTTNYSLVVEFSTPDLRRHHRDFSVQQTEYNAEAIGGRVPLRYVRSDPDRFFIAGQEPLEADVQIFHFILYVGLGCLAVALAVLAMTWGGGETGGRAPAPPKPPRPEPRGAAPTGDRAVFGRRG